MGDENEQQIPVRIGDGDDAVEFKVPAWFLRRSKQIARRCDQSTEESFVECAAYGLNHHEQAIED